MNCHSLWVLGAFLLQHLFIWCWFQAKNMQSGHNVKLWGPTDELAKQRMRLWALLGRKREREEEEVPMQTSLLRPYFFARGTAWRKTVGSLHSTPWARGPREALQNQEGPGVASEETLRTNQPASQIFITQLAANCWVLLLKGQGQLPAMALQRVIFTWVITGGSASWGMKIHVVQQEKWAVCPPWYPGSWFKVAPYLSLDLLSPLSMVSTIAKQRWCYHFSSAHGSWLEIRLNKSVCWTASPAWKLTSGYRVPRGKA